MLVPLKLLQDKPLQQQLHDQLRQLIVSGRLGPGSRMPSTRMLSDQFAVSRITVVLVYERLVAEGYLRTHPASGTFVAESGSPVAPAAAPVTGKALEAAGSHRADPPVGRPDPQLFPIGRWRAFMRRSLDRYASGLGSEAPGGLPALRRGIAEWLAATRGLTVSPDHVVVVGSRRRALDLAAHLLLRPTQRAVIEAPCEEVVAAAYSSAGARLLRVPVDRDGLRVDRLPACPVGLLHLTPARQRPLGVTLSPQRRRAVIEWAIRTGATIVEEDNDGDFRYEPAAVPPLMSLPDQDRVVYAGSFAATLGPGVSLGYVVVPERLASAAIAARATIDDRAGWLEEAAIADFIDSGCYARHVHRLRKIYAGRRAALLESLRDHFGAVRIDGHQTGLELAWTIPASMAPAAELAGLACRSGIGGRALDRSASIRRDLSDRVVLLDYATGSERGIREAIGLLAATLGRNGRRELVAAIGD
jgi:GntR family transcriptional regulator/MocR family aminotransferase